MGNFGGDSTSKWKSEHPLIEVHCKSCKSKIRFDSSEKSV
ncbi:hypothetical protein DOT_0520 [Desulfosporosinus sp. OT]|nr:hypothetical protein DOT_0520 [Desulfosporosinus sp. OT]